MEPPLTGIRVLDFGMAAVGPIAAEYLGWMGADVIKVESPTGDVVRQSRPRLKGVGHTFLGNNLGKRGIVLDLKTEEGHRHALELIQTADILIENFRSPDVMRKLGLGYERLREVNPRLIYLQSSAYGPNGPMYGMTSNEWFSQASGGLTSVTGSEDGRPEFSRGTATLDWNGAFTNLQALLVALYVRNRTGRGMFIQTSQLQSTMFSALTRIAEYLATDEAPRPMGSARPNIVPDQAFATADGYVTVTALNDRLWRRLCDAIERPALADDARFAINPARVEHRRQLLAILEPTFRTRTSAEWVARLRAAGVPAGEFQTGRTLSDSLLAHSQARDMVTVLDTPWGPMASSLPHWHWDKTEARIPGPAPAHGQHTAEVLAEKDTLIRLLAGIETARDRQPDFPAEITAERPAPAE